jgi:hypothetical protein
MLLHINIITLFLQAVTGGIKDLCSITIDESGALSLQQQHGELQQVEIDSAHRP